MPKTGIQDEEVVMFKFRKSEIVLVGLVVLSLVGVGCAAAPPEVAPPEATEVVLKVSGSGSTTSLLAAVAPAFEADTPGYKLETLTGTGSGGGVQGVTEGVLDVSAMARPPKDEELEAAPDLQYVEFGQGAVALFNHPDVDVTNLSSAQAVGILSGEITSWSEVGGPNSDIILYVRDEADTSTKSIREAFFGDTLFPDTAQVVTSQGAMEAAVGGTPDSIGFGAWVSVLAADVEAQGLGLDGTAPGDTSYPITKPVGVAYLAERQADVQPLIDWLLSERGQAVLQEYDVITPQ
jgi:phosphate transport system substrate-binding protein